MFIYCGVDTAAFSMYKGYTPCLPEFETEKRCKSYIYVCGYLLNFCCLFIFYLFTKNVDLWEWVNKCGCLGERNGSDGDVQIWSELFFAFEGFFFFFGRNKLIGLRSREWYRRKHS